MEAKSRHQSVFKGVIDGCEQEFDLERVKEKFQVFIFYPSDFDDDSYSVLSSFSSLSKQFSSSDCFVYGCSTDSPGAHLDWIKDRFDSSLPFPLLSDPAGKLASRFSLFDREERINMRAVVITDNQGIALEVINTSLEDQQMTEYALSVVKQTLEHRRTLLEKRCHFQQPYTNPVLEQKLEELASYSLSVVKQAGNITSTRGRSVSRSLARSVSRGRSLVRTESKQSYRDPVFANQMKRTEDRLMRGFF
eukprot:GFUD01014238.1.p1 GENE.GFUD01014238.1~~GFUD01014238.1.p1  ORF type:complete len:249 (+),score=90.65 GFUD01014238.1:110-856(+)